MIISTTIFAKLHPFNSFRLRKTLFQPFQSSSYYCLPHCCSAEGKEELLYAFGNKYAVRPASIMNTHGCTRIQTHSWAPDTGQDSRGAVCVCVDPG